MLGGVSLRWKQIVCYHFTGNSTHGDTLSRIAKEIKIKSTKTQFQNSIVNPNNKSRNVDFAANAPPLSKNVQSNLMYSSAI